MYLKTAHIINFRKIDDTICTFNCGLNLIVGANDSGKTAVIDALRLVLKQVVDDYVRLQSDDFKDPTKEINIDLTFSFDDCSTEEELVACTSLFAEYLSFGEGDVPELKIWYTAKSDEKGIKFPSFKVGPTKEVAVDMDPYCREKFKVIYLRPLRDAENELRAKQGSRISRILKEHTDIKSNELELKGFLEAFEQSSESFFSAGGNGEKISEEVKRLLDLFDEQSHHSKKEIKFGPTEKIDYLKALERIALYYEGLNKPGLGTLNMIFIAAELLHLNTQKNPNMLLVEEIEAHLHPQRQLKIIRALQDESKKGIQMILTTHSPNLASVVDIERLCAINNAGFYSLSKGSTKLTPENYSYLGRFLSTTKANLFFAQGVILVEGPTEQLLLPEMAKVLGYDLIDYGLSVVSTNGLGFEHFINIFKRRTAPYNTVPVVVMTDADKRNDAKITSYTDSIVDTDNKIGCFVGEQLNSALQISKDQGTTFETLILSKTKELKQLYLDAYNSKVQRERALLTDDMPVSFMYSRMKKKKAVLAQEVAQKISDLLDSKDPKIEIINRYTHLPCLTIESIITGSGKKRDVFVEMVNENFALVPFVIQEILRSAYKYEEKTDIIEEEIELTKLFPFKISVQQGRNTLVVYKEAEAEEGRKGRLGFHINPYAFDSGDEKDLFRYLRDVLDKDETIKDVYFTGARVCADPSRTDFYFEYWSPEQKRVARYFPDFLIETTKRFIVVEAKGSDEKTDYETNKQSYKGKIENLTNEILAKEIGFNEFQSVNKNFEYHIIFDASLQREQLKLLEELKKK